MAVPLNEEALGGSNPWFPDPAGAAVPQSQGISDYLANPRETFWNNFAGYGAGHREKSNMNIVEPIFVHCRDKPAEVATWNRVQCDQLRYAGEIGEQHLSTNDCR